MPSNHLILCRPLLLLPSIFPSIRVFSNESALRIRWPKYWSFSFNISPSKEYYLAIKKNKVVPFAATWMELDIVIQSKVCQRRRQIPYSIIYTWNLKYDTDELVHKTETDLQRENRLRLPRGRRDGGGVEWVSGISRFRLVYRERTNKNYCGSQGTILSTLWQTIMQKKMKKRVCMSVTESLC